MWSLWDVQATSLFTTTLTFLYLLYHVDAAFLGVNKFC